MKKELFPFEERGIGRKDYSAAVEFSVEPIIRSYQEDYSYWDTITVAAGDIVTKDVAISTGYVVLLYDFFATIPTYELISLSVFAISDGVVGRVIEETKYGSIDAHLSKGAPFFQTIRFRVENMGENSLDINIGTTGIETTRSTYLLISPAGPTG